MVRALPTRPSLEHLKGQAKDLLAALRRGDEKAQKRFGRWFDADSPPFRLAQAQLVLAREQGFSSWRQLAAWVTDRRLPSAPPALVALLGARTGHVRRAAAAALTALGHAGVTAAIDGLSHQNPHVRRGAADFMDHHADGCCVPTLVELALHDPVPDVRGMAMPRWGASGVSRSR